MLSKNVYIIDDSEHVRVSMASFLEKMGYTVHAFDTPEYFLLDVVINSPAVILTDMRMPKMSGLELFRRLSDTGSTTPVIFLSGESTPHEIIDSLKKGANDFLIKPVDNAALIHALENALAADHRAQIQREKSRVNAQLVDRLTEREREICVLILKGFVNKKISQLLDVKPDTIKKHRAQIYEKLGARTLADLLDLGLEEFLTLSPP
jgi:two-component system response regulator FixJ